jgi:hypothetical protein
VEDDHRMKPEELKLRFDAVTATLRLAQEELERLSVHLTTRIDQSAAKSIITDLVWAVENCTVLGLHQIGEALDDPMWDAQPHSQQDTKPGAAPDTGLI